MLLPEVLRLLSPLAKPLKHKQLAKDMPHTALACYDKAHNRKAFAAHRNKQHPSRSYTKHRIQRQDESIVRCEIKQARVKQDVHGSTPQVVLHIEG